MKNLKRKIRLALFGPMGKRTNLYRLLAWPANAEFRRQIREGQLGNLSSTSRKMLRQMATLPPMGTEAKNDFLWDRGRYATGYDTPEDTQRDDQRWAGVKR